MAKAKVSSKENPSLYIAVGRDSEGDWASFGSKDREDAIKTLTYDYEANVESILEIFGTTKKVIITQKVTI